jgi:hypothetical protein
LFLRKGKQEYEQNVLSWKFEKHTDGVFEAQLRYSKLSNIFKVNKKGSTARKLAKIS